VPFALLGVLILGIGLGIGLGLSEAPSTGRTAATGHVVAQPHNATVRCKVARGSPGPPCVGVTRTVTVPIVVGKTPAQAETTLSAAGLETSFIPRSSQMVPLSIVMAQSPVADSRVADGSSVTLTQSAGPPSGVNIAPLPMPMPTTVPATAPCQPNELAAAAVSYDYGGTVLSLVFFVDDVGTTPCSIPAVASVALFTNTGDVFGTYGSPGTPALMPGFFELLPQPSNRATIISGIDNWCGQPTPPTTADITLSGVGTVAAPLNPRGIGRGIVCYDTSSPPGVQSPVQVDLVPNS
jgi:hypothetical protein